MTEWISCPKCGALMLPMTGGNICPLCGYKVPVQTITTTTGTSVEYVPVRYGKWVMKPDPFGFFDEIPVCSECGCTTKMREKTKYCPNCGARMDEE